MQTYYDEHPEKNPCGDDGENPYGWHISDGSSGNEDYGTICSTGPGIEEEETCNNDGVCNTCGKVKYDPTTQKCCEKSGQYLVCGKTDTCVLDSNYIIACQEYREPIPEKCDTPPEGEPQGRYLCTSLPLQTCSCWSVNDMRFAITLNKRLNARNFPIVGPCDQANKVCVDYIQLGPFLG